MIIFLYGPDDFRARKKITELRDKFIAEVDPSASSLVSFDGGKATVAELSEACRSQSLFVKRRFVAIDCLLSNKDKSFIEEVTALIAEQKDNQNILVVYEPNFTEKKTGARTSIMKPGTDDKLVALNKAEKKLFDTLSQAQAVQAFMFLPPLQLQKTLAALAGEQGVSLSAPAANLLIRLVGSDLWPLSNEVNKLAAYKRSQTEEKEKPAITEADVRELVSQSITENIFALTDALGSKQTAAALKLLQDQLASGVNVNYLLTMMLWQFKTLASVRQALDTGASSSDLASALGLHPYVLEKSINQVRKFSFTSLENIINRLVELDYKQKTGQGDLEALLPVAVARF